MLHLLHHHDHHVTGSPPKVNFFGSLPHPPLHRLLLTLLLLALVGLENNKQSCAAEPGQSSGGVLGSYSTLCRQSHLSLGLSEQAAEALVPQSPVGELGGLPGLRLLQSQLQLPQGAQLLHQLPLTRPAGLEIQLQVQGGTGWLLSQGGAKLTLHTYWLRAPGEKV
ncbi:hypothetical protein INR49_008640 [Caranx melampygus]|nr:hypothetical protein INR49_008640 [Caranx melampygus]